MTVGYDSHALARFAAEPVKSAHSPERGSFQRDRARVLHSSALRRLAAKTQVVEVGSAETFRDEDMAYANAIWQAGGQAELHVWPGAFHGFDTFAPRAALSQDARNARSRWLRRILTQSDASSGPAC